VPEVTVKHVLLLGAGFSRNWGGWLASEMMGELCSRVADDPNLLMLLRGDDNFEVVLGNLRQLADSGGTEAKARFSKLDRAISETFAEMNAVFASGVNFALANSHEKCLHRFLSFFDAIFTLNQDLLLETNYCNHKQPAGDPQWAGYCLPGVPLPNDWPDMNAKTRLKLLLAISQDREIPQRRQPIFKLHGSVNWRGTDGSPQMIVGTGKEVQIQRSDLLRWYGTQFANYLNAGDTRLMVIGYSFSDEYLNKMLTEAAISNEMKLYLVDPDGLRVLDQQKGGLVKDWALKRALNIIGVSSRSFRETFEHDSLSLASFYRFLGQPPP